MNPLEWIGGNELDFEICETRLQSVRTGRAATTWLGPFQRDKVPADGISLAATLGERVFVRRGETWLV